MSAEVYESTGAVHIALTVVEPDPELKAAITTAVSELAGPDRRPRGRSAPVDLAILGPGAALDDLAGILGPKRITLAIVREPALEQALLLGADDAILYRDREGTLAELKIRAARLLDARRRAWIQEVERRDLEALLKLSEALSDTRDIEGTLFHIARQVAAVLQCERCSIILLGDEGSGFVVAASDDPSIRSRQIAIEHYPEISEVVRTAEPLVIADVHRDPRFDGVRDRIRGKKVGNTALFPILLDHQVVGVIHARGAAVRTAGLSEHQLRFGSIVANSAAIAVRNARLYESIRARAERVLSARFRAERRMRQLEKYQLFFDLAGDGLVIVDGRGQILFANREARSILGFEAADITQIRLHDLVETHGSGRLEELLGGFLHGAHRRRMDLPVIRADGQQAILSMSTASLDPEGDEGRGATDVAAIISFRDVTETRRIETELRKTKDFLESLIESSADAIIAADTAGRILVFNNGAERITGYTREEALGKLNVGDLYRPGVAREIMRRLRGPADEATAASPGRYRSSREELIARDGTVIPISLAVALIYEDDREIASVGVFSDLRERLRMEEQLALAQRQLELSERQAAVVELAGAAAHGLSQPLTSILGSAELMARKVPLDSPATPLLERIVSECERMAEIVKSIGRITTYQTKPYLGETKILDLDASSNSEGKR